MSANDSQSIAAARDVATVLALLVTAFALAQIDENTLASTALGGALAFAVPSNARRAPPAVLALLGGIAGASVAGAVAS